MLVQLYASVYPRFMDREEALSTPGQSDRETALRLAILGILASLRAPAPPMDAELLAETRRRTIGRRIDTHIRQALDKWDRTATEPDWAAVVEGLRTDGLEYVGPSGGWVDYAEEEAPILAYTAEVMAADFDRQLNAVLSALGELPNLEHTTDQQRIDAAADRLNAEAAEVLDLLAEDRASAFSARGLCKPPRHDFEAVHRLARLAAEVDRLLTVEDLARRPTLRALIAGAEEFVVATMEARSFDEAIRRMEGPAMDDEEVDPDSDAT